MIAMEQVPCNQCGSTAHHAVARGRDREYFSSEDTYSIVRCDGCGLLFLNPRPVASELSRIYPDSYHSYIIDEEKASRGSFITRMRQKAAARRFLPTYRKVAGLPHIDVLDVGCGNGWMLTLFKGFAPEKIGTFGVEINQAVCDIARKAGHKVYAGRFEDVATQEQYDVVNLTHVIEHVSDPRAVVKKAYSALKPGGFLVLETPNADTVEWNWFKSGAWGAYHIPRHWYFYTPKSIRLLCESEGFAMTDIMFHPGPTHWVWTMHNLSLERGGVIGRMGRVLFDPVRIFRSGLVSSAMLGFFWLWDIAQIKLTGRSSVMTAIFQKR